MFIGIADGDQRRSDAVSALIRIEFGIEVRRAPTLDRLLQQPDGNVPALVIVDADRDELAPIEASAIFPGRLILLSALSRSGGFDAPTFSTPINASRLLAAVASLLSGPRSA